MWTEGQATWEEYRNVVKACRDTTRKGKIHLKLNLSRDVKDSKKSFCKYISSKRKTRDDVRPPLSEVGVLVMEDAEKAELLNAFFASVVSAKAGPQESQALEVREEACRKDYLPLVEEDCVRDHLCNLDAPQIHGPRRKAPRSTEEADRCHYRVTLLHLWKVLEDRRGAQELEQSQSHSNLEKGQEGGSRELQTSQPYLHPGKDDGASHCRGHHQASGGKEGYQE